MSLQSFGFFGFLLVVAVVYLHLPQRLQSGSAAPRRWRAAGDPCLLQIQRRVCGGRRLAGRGHAAGHQLLHLCGHLLPD
mgnify:CR=1 FL=1